MKKTIFLFMILISCYSSSQELMNFYLSPFTINNEVSLTLHTTFYHYHGAGLSSIEYTVDGNAINVTLCYVLGSTTEVTIDHQSFDLILPEGNGNYTINIDLISSYTNDLCTTYIESGSMQFEFPYHPIEKIEILDDLFEKNLEYLKFGDGIENNDLVFKHKIENIKSLYLRNFFPIEDPIENLNGIKFFKSLKRLRCQNNLITSLDFTHNTELEYLNCGNENLESVNVSTCLNLRRLYTGNNLSELDVTNNILLDDLRFSGNNISSIDLSNNVNLQTLSIGASQLNSLDLSYNHLLEDLGLSNNLITSLDLSNIPNLKYLRLKTHY